MMSTAKKSTNSKILLAALLVLFISSAIKVSSAATSSGSATISISFVGTGVAMGSAEVAGVVPKSNWNNLGWFSGTSTSVVDETGAVSGATVSWNANGLHALPITDQPGNVRMMKGYLDSTSSPTTVNVSGLPASSGGYSVYVYADGDNGSATRTATYQISGPGITTTTIGLTDPANTNFAGTFSQANNSNGNYVVFTISGSNFTLSATPVSASDGVLRAPLNGIQIVPGGSVGQGGATPDFTLATTPSSSSVSTGGSTTATVAVAPVNGFTGSVNLSVSGLPAGVSASLSPASVTPGANSTLSVSAAPNTLPGSSMLSITGASTSVTHTIALPLTVNSSAAQAGKAISINFSGSGNSMASTEVAGVLPKSNWNNLGWFSGTSTSVVDETGAVSGATVSWNANGLHALPITDQPGNVRMMEGYLDSTSSPTTVNVSGLPASSSGYSVYVYADGDNNSATRTGTYQISGTGIPTTSVSLTDAANTNFSGTFTQASNSAGNYVVFGVNATAFTITAIPGTASDGIQRAPLNGIQIVALGGSGGTGGSGGSAPSITAQPSNVTVTAGQTATFSVLASGTAPLTYAWRKNGAVINGATGSTYTTPATTTADNGASLSVVVSNASGSTASNPATLTVNANTTPPTVSIVSPTAGSTLSGTTTVTASASDNVGVASVQLQVDGTNVGSADTTSPYSFSLDTTTFSNGTHSLTAVAADVSGNRATSAALSVNISNSVSIGTPGPLAVCTSNPRYFCDPNGNVIFLAGESTWANLIDRGTINPPPAFDYGGYTTFMKSYGYNWMRLWTKELVNSTEVQDNYGGPLLGSPFKWVRAGPGTANDGQLKFDFTRLDPNYYSRMRARIIQAGQNGIYVSVMLFNGADWTGLDSTDGNPFESANNVNGVNCGNASDPCPTDNSQLPAQVWAYEQAYINKVVDSVHDLPNVMYEVTNESPLSSASWQASVIAQIRTYESTTYRSAHPIGINYGNNIDDSNIYNTDADYVSPSAKFPPAATGQCPVGTGNGGATNQSSASCKVVINDTDHSYYWVAMQSDGPAGQINWAWENFTLGNGVAFMDPYFVVWTTRNNCAGAPFGGDHGVCTGLDSQWNQIRSAIGDIAAYGRKVDLKNMTPQQSLSTSGFCLANPGSQYFVFSTSNSFTLTAVPGNYLFEWFNPSTHTISQTGTVTVGGSQTFAAPFSGQAVLWLHK